MLTGRKFLYHRTGKMILINDSSFRGLSHDTSDKRCIPTCKTKLDIMQFELAPTERQTVLLMFLFMLQIVENSIKLVQQPLLSCIRFQQSS